MVQTDHGDDNDDAYLEMVGNNIMNAFSCFFFSTVLSHRHRLHHGANHARTRSRRDGNTPQPFLMQSDSYTRGTEYRLVRRLYLMYLYTSVLLATATYLILVRSNFTLGTILVGFYREFLGPVFTVMMIYAA